MDSKVPETADELLGFDEDAAPASAPAAAAPPPSAPPADVKTIILNDSSKAKSSDNNPKISPTPAPPHNPEPNNEENMGNLQDEVIYVLMKSELKDYFSKMNTESTTTNSGNNELSGNNIESAMNYFSKAIILVEKESRVKELPSVKNFNDETGLTISDIQAINGYALRRIFYDMKNKNIINNDFVKYLYIFPTAYTKEDVLELQLVFFDYFNQMLFLAKIADETISKFESPMKTRFNELKALLEDNTKFSSSKIFGIDHDNVNEWWNEQIVKLRSTGEILSLTEFTDIVKTGPKAISKLLKLERSLFGKSPFTIEEITAPDDLDESASGINEEDAEDAQRRADIREKAANLYKRYPVGPVEKHDLMTTQELMNMLGVGKKEEENPEPPKPAPGPSQPAPGIPKAVAVATSNPASAVGSDTGDSASTLSSIETVGNPETQRGGRMTLKPRDPSGGSRKARRNEPTIIEIDIGDDL